MPRAGGASSTPRLLGSIIAVSGILGHPPSRVTTVGVRRARAIKHTFAISRHELPEVCIVARPLEKEGAGKTGCALHPRSRVQLRKERAHEHTGPAESIRPSLRNGLTAYFVLSPVTNSFCHRLRGSMDGRPVGPAHPPRT